MNKDVIKEILQYLDCETLLSILGICKLFDTFINDILKTKSIRIRNYNSNMDLILNKFKFVKYIETRSNVHELHESAKIHHLTINREFKHIFPNSITFLDMYNTILDPEVFKKVSELENLKTLYIKSGYLEIIFTQYKSLIPKIKGVLCHNDITSFLLTQERLDKLDLEKLTFYGSSSVLDLIDMKSLTYLRLPINRAVFGFENLTNLKYFIVRDNTNVLDVSNLTNIKILDISNFHGISRGISNLENINTLITHRNHERFLLKLNKNCRILELHINSECHLSDNISTTLSGPIFSNLLALQIDLNYANNNIDLSLINPNLLSLFIRLGSFGNLHTLTKLERLSIIRTCPNCFEENFNLCSEYIKYLTISVNINYTIDGYYPKLLDFCCNYRNDNDLACIQLSDNLRHIMHENNKTKTPSNFIEIHKNKY